MNEYINTNSRKWTKLAKSCKVVPSDRNFAADASEAYLFRLVGIDNVPVPKVLVDKLKSSEYAIQVHLSATLYDTKGKEKEGSFLGNTWTGQRLLFKECSSTQNDAKAVKWNGREAILHSIGFGEDYGFVFHTKIKAEDLRLIVELVLTVCDKDCKVRLEEHGICWGLLLLKNKDESQTIDCKDLEKHIIVDALYSGTPRLILFVGTNPTQLKKAKIDGAQVKHFTLKHHKLKDVAMQLMVENELCGGGDMALGLIPGLEAKNSDDPSQSIVRGLINFNCTEVSLAEKTILVFQQTTFHIATDLESQIKAYLSEHAGQAKDVRAMSLAVEVGVHNGRRFIGNTLEEKLVGKAVQMINLESGGAGVWKVDRITVEGCIASPFIAVVLLLHAKVTIDSEESQICLGWIPLLPWDSSGTVIVGVYKAELHMEMPMMSISNCLLFRDSKNRPPEISTTIRLAEGQSRNTVDLTSVLAKEASKKAERNLARGLDGKRKDDGDQESKESSDAESVADEAEDEQPSLLVSSRRKPDDLPLVPSKPAETDTQSDEEGVLESFNLQCTTKGLGTSQTVQHINKIAMDISLDMLLAKLQETFGQRVCFEYVIPEGQEGAGSRVRVDNVDNFNELLDLLDDDAEGPNRLKGTMPVDVLPWPRTPPAPPVESHGATAAGGKAANAGQTPASAGGAGSVRKGQAPLEHIVLDCDISDLRSKQPSASVKVPVGWNWAKAKELLMEELGERVIISYDDIDGKPIRIDGEAAWQALVKEILDDWDGDCEFDGGMDVTVHRVPASGMPAPSTAGITQEPAHHVPQPHPQAPPAPQPPASSSGTAAATAPSQHPPSKSISDSTPSSKSISNSTPSSAAQPSVEPPPAAPAASSTSHGGAVAPAAAHDGHKTDIQAAFHPAVAGDLSSIAKPRPPVHPSSETRTSSTSDKASVAGDIRVDDRSKPGGRSDGAEVGGKGGKVVDSRSYGSGRDDSDSLPDENSPPANRPRPGGVTPKSTPVVGRAGNASRVSRQLLSTDGSDMEEGRKRGKVAGGGGFGMGSKGRKGRHYEVEQEQGGADRDLDLHVVPGRPEPPSSMSRALKARLFTTSISALVPGYRREVPFVETGAAHLVGMDLSLETGGQADVVIQILAARLPPVHSRVFFTLQFYHFPAVETAVAALEKIPAEELPGEDDNNKMCPCMLHVLDTTTGAQRRDVTGIVIQFAVDASGEEAGQKRPHSLARYLAARTLCVHVWDADSLLLVGTAQVDLRCLLRQGKEAVQTGGEFGLSDPVDSSLFPHQPYHPSSSNLHSIAPSTAAASSLFVRLINVGHSETSAQEAAPSAAMKADPVKATLGGRVLPLTDLDGGLATAVQGQKRQGIARGLALLFARIADVRGQLGNSDAAVTAERLQEGMIEAGLELTLREVTAVTLHLTPSAGGVRTPADLSRLRLAGTDDIVRSGEDMAACLAAARALLEWVAGRYDGDVRKSLAALGCNESVTTAELSRLLKEAQEGGVKVPPQAGEVLERVLGMSHGKAVAVSEVVRFLTVEYASAVAAGPAAAVAQDKKTARWQRVRSARRQDKGGGMRGGEGGGVEEENVLLMEAAKKLREVHKVSKIKQFLEESITTREVILPCFGQTCYLPYLLRSPYSEERVIMIHIDDPAAPGQPELELVTKAEEWRELERQAGRGFAAVEQSMLAREGAGHTVWLQAHQQLTVPFKFRSMSPAPIRLDSDALHGHCVVAPPSPAEAGAVAPVARVITVTFAARTNGGGQGPPLYVLQVEVRPRPFVVDHVFRMYQGQNDFLRRKILVDTAADLALAGWRSGGERGGGEKGAMKHVWCSEGSVVVGCSVSSEAPDRLEVLLKCRCGAAGSEQAFYVVLYNDAWHVSVYEIWLVRVRVVNRMDMEGLVGQTEPGVLMLRSRDGAKTVRGYSSHPDLLSLPDRPRHIDAALSDMPLHLHALAAGRRDVLIHIVEPPAPGLTRPAPGSASEPVSAWLVSTRAKLPLVSKRYDIRLPVGRVCNKKILYTNPYSVARVYKLKTDQPSLVGFKDPSASVPIPPFGQEYIGLRFGIQSRAGRREVLVFINDEEDKTDECLAISVTYF